MTRSSSVSALTVSRPGIGALRDVAPRREDARELRRPGSPDGELLGDVRIRRLALREGQEVALLLPRQVTDIPADGVHRHQATAGVLLGHAAHRAHEFRAREPQLVDERMSHATHI